MISEVDLGQRSITSSEYRGLHTEQRSRTTVVEADTVPWVTEDLRLPTFENTYFKPTVSIVDRDAVFSELSQGVEQDAQDAIMRHLSNVSSSPRVRILDDELRNTDSQYQQPIRQGIYSEEKTFINGEEVDLMELAKEGVEINLGDLEFTRTEVNFFFISYGPVKESRQVLVGLNDSSEQSLALQRLSEEGYNSLEN